MADTRIFKKKVALEYLIISDWNMGDKVKFRFRHKFSACDQFSDNTAFFEVGFEVFWNHIVPVIFLFFHYFLSITITWIIFLVY